MNIVKKYLSATVILLFSLILFATAFVFYTLKDTHYQIETSISENFTFSSDERYDLPLTTLSGGTIQFEHTMETTSKRPYYKVMVYNSGSHTMYIDIGDSKDNIVDAGQTKSFYGNTNMLSRNQDIFLTCEDGYSLYGQIEIKISDVSLE